ncbi:MAG: hypothetical protein JNM66_04115 [Bryobacterales bacterium]|nr:hypothetical protein [Bryobacterales bacterium]
MMNSTGKFLVSALLVHAANLKKLGDTQTAIQIPKTSAPASQPTTASPSANK